MFTPLYVFELKDTGSSVSYTHLDVYKRQAMRCAKESGRRNGTELFTYPEGIGGLTAVLRQHFFVPRSVISEFSRK